MINRASASIEAENMSFIESVVRGLISIASVAVVMHMPSVSGLALFGLTQLAIYAGLTAFIGWDPVYAVFKQGQSRLPAQSPAKLDVHSRQEGQAAADDHKKAA